MPKKSLTAASVEKLKPPKAGQVDYFDNGYPGLALRISYGGRKSWNYFYRHDGKLRRLPLGTWPALSLAEAHDAWREARKSLEAGYDPGRKIVSRAQQQSSGKGSFEAVAGEWFQREQIGKERRSAGEVRRILDRDILPLWRKRKIGSITRADARELIDSIEDRGAPTMARRIHAHLHALFRWAVGRDLVDKNPFAELPKPGRENPRERFLNDREIKRVWKAAGQLGFPFGPAIQLLTLTAGRREEIAALRWSEIDGDTIRLSGERTKNGEPRTIPLSETAQRLIEQIPRIADSEFVFTTTGKTPISGWSRAKKLLDSIVHSDGEIPDWRTHDLRRSVATGMQRLGINLQTIEATLGHSSGTRAGIVAVYQRHNFEPEKRQALNAWADHIAELEKADG